MSPIAPIPEVPEPPKISRSQGLGALAENSLVRFFVQVFNRAKDGLAELVRNALERLLESLEKEAAKMAGPMIDDILDMPGIPESTRRILVEARNPTQPAAIIALVGAVFAVVMMIAPAALSGVTAKVQQASFAITRPFLLDFSTWYVANLRNPGNRDVMRNDLQGQGWRDEQIDAALLAAEQRLGAGEILAGWHRQELTTAQATTRLKELGVALGDIALFLSLSEQIPGPSDLVRFALREAWRDDVAQKYGYDQGQVPEFSEWMGKQGFSDEWARAYWRSHWMVPAIGQGFEMLHRGVITEDELVDLLKVNDIAPGWIPHLLDIARPVPGRIDRRWAYQEGEITENELFDLYKSDGYDDRWADVLTNVVMKRAVSEAKGLTRSAIVAAYKKRRLSEAETLDMLEDIGISESTAYFYMGQADADRVDALLDRRMDAVGKRFRSGDIDESQARDELTHLGVGADEIDVALEEWEASIVIKVKKPSRANLDRFFRDGVIDVDSYRNQMDWLGYMPVYVDWYLASLAIERQEIAEKEERDARVERERVEKDKQKTDYQLAKALVDVDIAEINAAISTAQVALVEAQNERERQLTTALPATAIAALKREYQPLLFDADAAISEARLRIADLQSSIKENRETISQIDASLIANVDQTVMSGLRAERLTAQTEQARLGELIAGDKLIIAQLKQAMPTYTDDADIMAAEEHMLALQTEIAQYQEQQATWLVRIEEIDEAMEVTLSLVRRGELQAERASLLTGIASLERDIAGVNATIREVQRDREVLEAELDAEITALPGSDRVVEIKKEFLILIGGIQSNISEYRENIAQLRLSKSQLAAEWRG